MIEYLLRFISALVLVTGFSESVQAESCRPKDALPPGTYIRSCNNCKISKCEWLICSCGVGNCDWLGCEYRETSIHIPSCPEGSFWNEYGTLRCGR